jgi:hypothetical protein
MIAENSAIHRFQTPSCGGIREIFLHVLDLTSEIVGFKYPGKFYGVLLNFLDSHHLGRHHRQNHGCRATSYDTNLVSVNFVCISVTNMTKPWHIKKLRTTKTLQEQITTLVFGRVSTIYFRADRNYIIRMQSALRYFDKASYTSCLHRT